MSRKVILDVRSLHTCNLKISVSCISHKELFSFWRTNTVQVYECGDESAELLILFLSYPSTFVDSSKFTPTLKNIWQRYSIIILVEIKTEALLQHSEHGKTKAHTTQCMYQYARRKSVKQWAEPKCNINCFRQPGDYMPSHTVLISIL